MEAKRSQKRWTYAEFAELPSDRARYEVIDGELVVTPLPSTQHQRISGRLFIALSGFVHQHGLGEVFLPLDVLFGEGDYLGPDIRFVPSDRAHLLTNRGIEGAPGLVIEILSPSTAKRDRGIKLERYRHFGVPEYWIVDPDQTAIEVWRFASAAASPQVVRAGDSLRWAPVAGGPTLELSVDEILSEARPA